ncbi:MAG: hypothetical protein CM1200mP18_17950 [Gammaproteobacteria bacterium]|nr:MAG: hypothetical protein CM1200mP18_17950 [Gammaproteobacteria bacterium]
MERDEYVAMFVRSALILRSSSTPWGKYPIVGDVRGSHFMMCIENVANPETKELLPEQPNIGKRIADHCQERGVIVRPFAPFNVMSPPWF